MKKIIYLIEFIIIYIFFFIFKIIGYKKSSDLGCIIGKIIGPFFRSKSKIIENLKKSKLNKNKDFNLIASEVFGNYGRIFAEYPHIKNFRNNKLDKFIEIENYKYLEQIKNEKKSVVFISGHFNNFELMAMQIEMAGINLAAIYRPLNNIFLNTIMEKIRKNYICKKQIKKGRSGGREIIENLKDGASIALMIDQRVTEGIKVNFFGFPATTTTIPEQIIKKYKCAVVPIYIERKNKYFFKMMVSKPINFASDLKDGEITSRLNLILEDMININPGQWIWTHDRWKK